MNCTAYNGRYLMMGFASNKAVADEKLIVPRRLSMGNIKLCGVVLAYADPAMASMVKTDAGMEPASARAGRHDHRARRPIDHRRPGPPGHRRCRRVRRTCPRRCRRLADRDNHRPTIVGELLLTIRSGGDVERRDGGLLPAAVGVALSPIPIIAVILMLDTPKARSNGPAFTVGWVVGLVAVSVIVLLVAHGADDPDSASSTSVNWVTLGLGVLFLGLAAKQWRTRPKKGEEPVMPKWMASVDGFTAPKSLVLGLALSACEPEEPRSDVGGRRSIAQAGLDARARTRSPWRCSSSSVRSPSPVPCSSTCSRGTRAASPCHDQGLHVRSQRGDHDGRPAWSSGAKLIGDGLSGVTH